jgi:hypothetical protein
MKMKNMEKDSIFELISKTSDKIADQVKHWENQEKLILKKINSDINKEDAEMLAAVKELKHYAKGQLILISRLEKIIKCSGSNNMDDNLYWLINGTLPKNNKRRSKK